MKAFSILIAAAIVIATSAAHAQDHGGGGGSEGGGGGNTNEIPFKVIAKNIADWINSGNADTSGIQLPAGVSMAQYKSEMLDAIGNYDVAFTTKPIGIDNHDKQCRSWVDESKHGQILCNVNEFPSDVNAQYQLVHHEFAGLKKLETNIGAKSDYQISWQISGYLKQELVMRLPVAPASPTVSPNALDEVKKYMVWAPEQTFKGACTTDLRKRVLKSEFDSFAHALGQLIASTGLKIRETHANIHDVATDHHKGVAGLDRGPFDDEYGHMTLSYILDDSVVLDVSVVSDRVIENSGATQDPYTSVNFDGYGTIFHDHKAYSTNGELIPDQEFCTASPLTFYFEVRNHDTQYVIIKHNRNRDY